MLGHIAARHPGLTLIVDHIGMRVFDIFKTPPSEDDQPNLMALRRYPNVIIKVSSIPEALVESHPFPKSQLRLQKIYDHFAPDRMMWGSNYPPSPKSVPTSNRSTLSERIADSFRMTTWLRFLGRPHHQF